MGGCVGRGRGVWGGCGFGLSVEDVCQFEWGGVLLCLHSAVRREHGGPASLCAGVAPAVTQG